MEPKRPRHPAKAEPRDRVSRLLVAVNSEERRQIRGMAEAANLSVSAYLRTAGLGYSICSALDHHAVRELCGLHGDLGRIGGLLKLWLADRREEVVPAALVDAAFRDLKCLQDILREKIEALV